MTDDRIDWKGLKLLTRESVAELEALSRSIDIYLAVMRGCDTERDAARSPDVPQ